jgi:hypothetical protein
MESERGSIEMSIAIRTVFWTMTGIGAVLGQTKVDLGVQSKNVDFSGAVETKPMKTGPTLPAACNTGDMFLLLSAPAGTNIYACVATNTWSLQSGNGSGNVTLQNNGTIVGTRASEDFISGLGMLNALSDTGTQLDIQQSFDPAVIQTLASNQAGTTLACASTSGSASAYTCAMNPTLTQYSTGMVLYWLPDVSGGGSATTINIDTLGAKPVTLSDGLTVPTAADIAAGKLYALWYDGTVMRLLTPPVNVGAPSVVQPACSVALRGRIWQVFGASGVKDSVGVCAKDATDAYAWRTIY